MYISEGHVLTEKQIHKGIYEVYQECRGMKLCLIGGTAIRSYGVIRPVPDIDFATLPTSELSHGVYRSRTNSGVPVDMYVNEYEHANAFREAIKNARSVSTMIPIASPEYLIVLKMITLRGKDILDIQSLIRTGNVDYNKAKRLVASLLGDKALMTLDYYTME